MTKKFELVFIPTPGTGQLASTVEIANILVTWEPCHAVSILAMKLPDDAITNEYIQSLYESLSNNTSIHIIVLPELPAIPKDGNRPFFSWKLFLISTRPMSNKILSPLLLSPTTTLLHLCWIYMFCTTMVHIANEFEVLYYVLPILLSVFILNNFTVYAQHNGNDEVIQ